MSYEYEALTGKTVLAASDGAPQELLSLWQVNGRCWFPHHRLPRPVQCVALCICPGIWVSVLIPRRQDL